MGHWKCHRLQNKKCKNLIWHFDIQRCSLLLKRALLFSKKEAIAQLFWGSDSIIRIIGNKTQQRQRRREALAFISFVIDHTYDKITQEGENGIWYTPLHSGPFSQSPYSIHITLNHTGPYSRITWMCSGYRFQCVVWWQTLCYHHDKHSAFV